MAMKSSGGTRSCASAGVTKTLDDGTGNLSKLRRDDLVKKLGAIRSFLEKSATGDTNVVRLLQFAAELEKEVRTKKYGLVFEEHKERVDVELEHNLPVLTENKKRFIDNGGDVNVLIEGDNLAALKLLEKTHRGKIDLIYIDPPYNTGNKDFVYNDKYVDATDTFRHSKWLSFMKKRLEVAWRLLSDKGAFFVSIDDNEHAALKLLCDEVFGDSSFRNTILVRRRTKTLNLQFAKNGLETLNVGAEYVCVYAKPGFLFREMHRDKNNVPSKGTWNVFWSNADRPTMRYELLGFTPKTGQWRWSKDKAIEAVENYEAYLSKHAQMSLEEYWESTGRTKRFVRRIEDGKGKNGGVQYWVGPSDYYLRTSNWTDIEVSQIHKEFDLPFSNPKSVELMMEIVSTPFDAARQMTILDFFAGSGTTGHAVMKLNANDGLSRRKFILVTNNENGICEKVTYERLKRVIEQEGYAARLKYYKIDYVPIDEKVYYEYADELLKHTRELVELENAVDFSKDKTVAIVLTDKEAAKFAVDEKRLGACKAVYVGHDVLMRPEDKKVIKKHGIKIKIIPQYYYPELEG